MGRKTKQIEKEHKEEKLIKSVKKADSNEGENTDIFTASFHDRLSQFKTLTH
jgi:hypothetical protein